MRLGPCVLQLQARPAPLRRRSAGPGVRSAGVVEQREERVARLADRRPGAVRGLEVVVLHLEQRVHLGKHGERISDQWH